MWALWTASQVNWGLVRALLPLKSKWRLVNGCNARSSNSSLSNHQSLGTVGRRHHRDDGDRQFAIRLDAFHQTNPSPPARLSGRGSVDLHTFYFSGNVAGSV